MTVPLESAEQKALAAWLDAIGVVWLHIPNESPGGDQRKLIAWRQQLKRLGVKKGAPDCLIFTPPPLWKCPLCGDAIESPDYDDTCCHPDGYAPRHRGTAIELKRQGATASAVTPDQRDWLERLAALGWATSWQPGAEAAIKWLEGLGYGAP